MLYFISFFLVAILIQVGMTTEKKYLKIIMLFLAVNIPAAMAGVRDYTVGTDVRVYGLSVFTAAQSSSSFLSFVNRFIVTIEPGYLLLSYICARLFSDVHVFFYVLGILIYGFLIKAIYDYKEQIVPGIAWLTYCFLYFGDSLNIMRQTVAVAIIIYAFKYVRNREIKQYIVCVILAMMFHQTAFCAIFLYYIYGIIKGKDKWLHYVWIVCGVIVLMLGYSQVLQVLINIGILADKYSRYLSGNTLSIMYASVLIRIMPIALILVFWKRFKLECRDADYLLVLIIIDLILYNAASMSAALYRICMYMGYHRMFAYSALCSSLKLKGNKKIVYSIIIIYLMVVFAYEVVINNGNHIYPYTSEILGI